MVPALLVLLAGCLGSDPRDAVFADLVPGATFVAEGPEDERIAYDSGVSRHSPVRITLLGYGEPKGALIAGERLVVLLEGEFAVYLFLDPAGGILRREVVGS